MGKQAPPPATAGQMEWERRLALLPGRVVRAPNDFLGWQPPRGRHPAACVATLISPALEESAFFLPGTSRRHPEGPTSVRVAPDPANNGLANETWFVCLPRWAFGAEVERVAGDRLGQLAEQDLERLRRMVRECFGEDVPPKPRQPKIRDFRAKR